MQGPINPDEVKRFEDRAEECLTLAGIASSPQAGESYRRMAEAYLILAGNAGSNKPRLVASTRSKSRPRLKQITSLKNRLSTFATELRDKASRLQPRRKRRF